MTSVSVDNVSINSYEPVVGKTVIEEIKAAAEKLSEKSVCHVNSTSLGGGVAEILHRLVPLMRDLGLDTEWKVIEGSLEFFEATKTIHNGLQGMDVPLTEEMKGTYIQYNEMNAQKIKLDHDFVVVHDNQPAAIISHTVTREKWLWRCHIDLSTPGKRYIEFLVPHLLKYDTLIFTMEKSVPKQLESKRTAIITPSIDPLSDKNRTLSETTVLSVLDKFDVDSERPVITQVSRFDPWKDPLGVIDVYRQVKKKIPGVQLLLITSMATDDPEGWTYYEKTARYAGQDYDVHLLMNMQGVGNVEVNAFQRASDVVLQKSIREGFGLTVAEALWKQTPVVAGDAGGIPLQVIQGKTGYLVSSIEEAAEKTIFLLEHPEKAKQIGRKGKEHVLKNFLITRHVLAYLETFLRESGGNQNIGH
ncbi:glycosyltransferase [Candidatus Bathyarchaeota archaeon]|nr:glycosyltransferase [Candidatus Bathyarchaeota archaeon]